MMQVLCTRTSSANIDGGTLSKKLTSKLRHNGQRTNAQGPATSGLLHYGNEDGDASAMVSQKSLEP